jgi:hypothetical protein
MASSDWIPDRAIVVGARVGASQPGTNQLGGLLRP